MGTIKAAALGGLELRDKSFDLAVAVLEAERAEESNPEAVPYLRVQARSLAKQLMTRIARDCAVAPT